MRTQVIKKTVVGQDGRRHGIVITRKEGQGIGVFDSGILKFGRNRKGLPPFIDFKPKPPIVIQPHVEVVPQLQPTYGAGVIQDIEKLFADFMEIATQESLNHMNKSDIYNTNTHHSRRSLNRELGMPKSNKKVEVTI